jgi:predicted nuclease of predicted toxin-antitoxin system
MKIALYFDEDSQDSTLIRALRSRGVDVIAASEAGMNGQPDDEQLQWSTTHNRVLYTCNARDFYKLHTSALTSGEAHGGIILAPQQQYSIGEQLRRLLKLIAAKSGEEMRNQVEFLSKWG